MKKILLALTLSPVFLFAQDCKLITETDPFTKATKLSTGFIKVDGGSISIDADAKEIDVLFTIEGADACFDNNSTSTMFLEGTKTKFNNRNAGTMNCEGIFHFIFKNNPTVTPSMLNRIMTMKINHIVFTGNNKKEFTLTMSPAQQEKIMTMSTCLVTQAKTLVK